MPKAPSTWTQAPASRATEQTSASGSNDSLFAFHDGVAQAQHGAGPMYRRVGLLAGDDAKPRRLERSLGVHIPAQALEEPVPTSSETGVAPPVTKRK